MTCQSQNDQLNLFEEDKPPIVLAPAQMAELGTLLEVLLREIAGALAAGGIVDDQDNV
jgi:hypothetical protein